MATPGALAPPAPSFAAPSLPIRTQLAHSVVAAGVPRLVLVQAARLRRPVAITTVLFTLAAVCLGAGAVAAGAGVLLAVGIHGVAGLAVMVLAACLYGLPLFLVVSCRNALASFPRFLAVLEHGSAATVTAGPPPDAGAAPAGSRRRAPVRILRATGRLVASAALPVRAAAESAGVWRLARPTVSLGGAVAFAATPALLLLGLTILGAGLVLA